MGMPRLLAPKRRLPMQTNVPQRRMNMATLLDYMPTPFEVNPRDVQFYDAVDKHLVNSQRHKARKLFELDCVEYNSLTKSFICKPIAGYNHTTYTILRSKFSDRFECDCQGFQTKLKRDGWEEAICSHVAAVFLYLRAMHDRKEASE
jgi:hypothetical protein